MFVALKKLRTLTLTGGTRLLPHLAIPENQLPCFHVLCKLSAMTSKGQSLNKQTNKAFHPRYVIKL